MTEVGIWDVSSGEPDRLQRGAVDLERQLEEWIESDPSLIQQGLRIVGRQVHLEAGRLDLLGFDPVGTWVVIEIKRGNVRRETIVQALDYAACLDALSPAAMELIVETYLQNRGETTTSFLSTVGFGKDIFAERNQAIFVVGTGRDPNLERLSRFLTKTIIPINVVNIDVFENAGRRFLLRQLTELDLAAVGSKALPQTDSVQSDANAQNEIERLMMLADNNGVGRGFRKVYEAAVRHGLYPRPYKWSIMYTPPQHKGRCLIVAWVKPMRKRLHIYVVSPEFASYFPVSEREATELLGEPKRHLLTPEDVDALVTRLDQLFVHITENM